MDELDDDEMDIDTARERRVDDALAELARGGSRDAAAAIAAPPPPEAVEPPSPEVPPGAVVAVVGGATAIGQSVKEQIGSSGNDWVASECQADASVDAAALDSALADAAAVVVVSAAAGGKGGVEPEALPKLMNAIPEGVVRLVYLSSHGVERTDQLPFLPQNLFGKLDKLRAAEQEVQLRALRRVPSFSVVRIGGLQDSSSASASATRCDLAAGDALQGAVSPSAAANVLVQSLWQPASINASFSAGPLDAAGLGTSSDEIEHWEDEFLKLVGPELLRKPLGAVSVDEAAEWLRDFARSFLEPGKKLTTPIEVVEVPGGALLRFVSRGGSGYRAFDDDETDDEKWAAAAAAAKGKVAPSKSDGALLLVAESAPTPRLRVARAEMDSELVVIKEMSEATVLQRLEAELASLQKRRA